MIQCKKARAHFEHGLFEFEHGHPSLEHGSGDF